MTELLAVKRAKGSLAEFGAAGVFAPADLHVAYRLSRLSGETDERVLLAAALAVRAVRHGSVCVELARLREIAVDEATTEQLAALPWPEPAELAAALHRSPLVAGGPNGTLRPLRLVDTDAGELLYLDRYYSQEATIRRILDERAASFPPIDPTRLRVGLAEHFGAPPDRQRIAAALAATHWTAVIAGGPGTGKTYAVARILALLFAEYGPSLRVGLAAPTGKAAAQLQEAVTAEAATLGLPAGLRAMTLHRLLGARGTTTRFRHDATNKLPYDVVVVDETSMVSLTMMCRLLEAVRPDARLLLVGDPDQLMSVDAGAVLADLVARPVAAQVNPALAAVVGADLAAPGDEAMSPADRDRLGAGVVRLSRGRRFGGAIAELAAAVGAGDSDAALEILTGGSAEVSLVGYDALESVRADILAADRDVTAAAATGDAAGALAALEAHRVLCAHRDGPYGVGEWNRLAQEWIGVRSGPADYRPGQPLLVTANDHDLRIYNGDTGVVVVTESGEPMAAFLRDDVPVVLHPVRLPALQTVYAMTIHRSQGSQYTTASVVLPEESSSLLTRELLYTAITRAREHVRIIGTADSFAAGVERRVLRASGLRY